MIGDGITAAAAFLAVSLARFGDGDSAEFWHHLGVDIRVAAQVWGGTLQRARRTGACTHGGACLEVPVIASDARGNAEVVGPEGGFTVPNGDPAGLARAMDRLLAEPHLGGTMGRLGRSRMVDRCSEEAVIAMHEAMYTAMLRERAEGSDS